jgi:HEAT repeat protein
VREPDDRVEERDPGHHRESEPGEARDALLAAMDDRDPRVAEAAASFLGEFPRDPIVAARLEAAARTGKFYRQREAALIALGQSKSPDAYAVLLEAARTESPDDVLRSAAFRGFHLLGDSRATPLVLEWAVPGRPLPTRAAAIHALGRLDENNHAITKGLLAALGEPIGQVRMAALAALDERRDPAAIAPLADLISRGEFTGDTQRRAQRVLERLRKAQADDAATTSPGGTR